MAIRPILYPLLLLVAWLLGQIGEGSERPVPPRSNESTQIRVEMKIVTLGEAMAERFRTLANFSDPKKAAEKQQTPTAVLSPAQLRAWLEMFQADPATNILCSPRLITRNEQAARVEVGNNLSGGEFNGLKVELLPQAARDGQTIAMRTTVQLTKPSMERVTRLVKIQDGEETQEVEAVGIEEKLDRLALKELLTMPAGQTIAVPVGKFLAEKRIETNPHPLLASIPYVSRLFRTVGVGRECQQVFLLVSAKVEADGK